jgi:hypothetical protein
MAGGSEPPQVLQPFQESVVQGLINQSWIRLPNSLMSQIKLSNDLLLFMQLNRVDRVTDYD